MDIMNFKSKFTTSIISKLVGVAVKKKFGYNIKLDLSDIHATLIDGDVNLRLNADVKISQKDLTDILNKIGL